MGYSPERKKIMEGTITLTNERYEELVKAEVKLKLIERAFNSFDTYDFERAASAILEKKSGDGDEC